MSELASEGQKKRALGVVLRPKSEGIGDLFDLVARMVEEGKEEYIRCGKIKGLGDKLRGVYGFSIKIGLGGRPIIIEHFGNIRQTE